MLRFKIEITCGECGSKNVETELYMNQDAGLLYVKCLDCDNVPKLAYDDEDLRLTINK